MQDEQGMNNGKGKPAVDRVLDLVYFTIEAICKILLMIMVGVIAYTVFMRFVINDTPTWGEELSIFCMVWIALLSSALAVRDGRHIRMTIISYFVPGKTARILHMGAYIFVFIVGAVFVIAGSALTELSRMSIMGALGISSAWLTLSLPVSGIAILLMLIARFRRKKW